MTTSNPPSDPPATFPSLDQLSSDIPPVSWLWPGWIPRGMITLLCAAPGAGKSYLALDFAHRLIAGLPWPDGAPPNAPGANVIYVDAEASPQLLNARAVAWGMDRSHLFPMLPATGQALDLNTPACQDHLLKMSAALRPALVIVDSLGSASRGVESQVAAVDALFAFLNEIAVLFQCGLVLIHHLRKRSAVAAGPRAAAPLGSDDVRGSGHIVSMARSVLGLAAVQISLDPQPNAPRRLQMLKTNLGPLPKPLGISFVGSDPGVTNLAYGPAPEPIHRCTAVESCARWLLYILAIARQPVRPNDLESYARQAGYSRMTLFRARELLGSQVVDTHGRHHPGNQWALPAPAPRPQSQS